MYGKLKKLFLSNVSLAIIAVGSLSSFAVTLIWRNSFEGSFNQYTLLITYISICASFGLLGMDQVFIRISISEDKKNYLSRNLFYYLILSGLIFSIAGAAYFHFAYGFDFISLFLISISISLILWAFNCLRLIKKFTESQIINNSYKAVLIIILLFFLGKHLDFDVFLKLFSAIIAVLGVVAAVVISKTLKISKKEHTAFGHLWLSFLINLGLLTFIGYGDRLVIDSLYGPDAMGMYFYYLTIFLFPLTLLQYYIGFKEIVHFKSNFDKGILFKKLTQIVMLSVVVILITYAIALIDNNHFLKVNFKEDLITILLLSFLGICKMIYALFSALIGAKGHSNQLYGVSVVTLLIIGISALILILLPNLGLNYIILTLIAIFASRSAYIYLKMVR